MTEKLPESGAPLLADREVAMSAAREGLMSSYTDHWPDIQAQIVDSILAAGFSRAAVPDAATERVAELEAEIEYRTEDRDYWYGIADKAKSQRDAANEDRKQAEAEIRDLLKVDIPSLKAERDAALAAVERIRVIHERDEHGLCVECSWEYPETSYDALSNDVSWPCPTIAALDGAPEPEWEYTDSEGDPGPHHLTRFSTDLGTLARRNENRERMGHGPLQVYRRRKAGPWLPVEGESKA